MHNRPSVLVFDVNETLIDIVALEPQFERMFGDRGVFREWFGQLVMYSMTVTLSDNYIDFFSLGQAVLRMTADVHRVPITDDDVRALGTGMRTMPAHPDVADGFEGAERSGLSPCHPDEFTAEPERARRRWSTPASQTTSRGSSASTRLVSQAVCPAIHDVAAELGVAPSACMMVAAHVWDPIGAQAAGFSGALITRPGNAPLPAP